MLLTGTHPRTLDDKKRLALPRRLLEQMGGVTQLFIAQGLDRCLWIYDRGGLERLSEKLDQIPATDAEARIFRRLFFAQMDAVDLDKSGRILIPERLAAFAGLEQQVVLLGVRDHLELWDARLWQEYLDRHARSYDAVAENTFGRRITGNG